jgi:hypothetical protein
MKNERASDAIVAMRADEQEDGESTIIIDDRRTTSP